MPKKPSTPKKRGKNSPKSSTPDFNESPEFSPDLPGIRRLVWVDSSDIDGIGDNPWNWRTHPEKQLEGVTNSILENGWAGALLYNTVTNRLVDGHARKKVAGNLPKGTPVPILIGTWTEEQEQRILLTLDPLAAMAGQSGEALKKLQHAVQKDMEDVRQLSEKQQTSFSNLIKSIPKMQKRVENATKRVPKAQRPEEDSLEATDDELPGIVGLKDDVDFPSDQPFNIPSLLPEKLIPCPEPIRVWTTPGETEESPFYLTVVGNGNVRGIPWDRTILCTHTQDEYFEDTWHNPASFTTRLLNRGILGAISSEFSVGNHPQAIRIFNTFRNRWVGRYWQEAGIGVIPSVSHLNHEEDREWLYAGIPKNAPCISVQIQTNWNSETEKTDTTEESEEYYRPILRNIVNILKPQSLLVYGGPGRDSIISYAKLPKTLHIISVANWMTERMSYLQEKRETV